MILIFHIIVALSSLVYTGYAFLFPSKQKLYSAYALVILTIASGTVLLIQNPNSMQQVCTTGLVYLACVSAGIFAVHHKLATIKLKS
jgi:hypothetical protein